MQKYLRPQYRFEGQRISEFQQIEVSPESQSVAHLIGETIQERRGSALFVDYGKFAQFTNSLTGIFQNKYVPEDFVLEFPGLIDLSFYVDFASIYHSCKNMGRKLIS